MRSGANSKRLAINSFQRSAQAIFQQSLLGASGRNERYRDFEQMDSVPEISTALNIYADDSCTFNTEGEVLSITSDDEKIVQELEELFFERINIEFYLWNWVRSLCKYGDIFLLLDVTENNGICGAIQIPSNEIEREEAFDNNPNSVRFKWHTLGNTTFSNYQISHMRILGDDRYLPYGRSVLEASRKVWRQLSMAEDAMLIYRFTRAPERRVYYIDVGNIPPSQVDSYIRQARDCLKRTPMVTESTGQIDMRYDVDSIAEDLFIPVRGERGTRVESLPGGQPGEIEDVDYLQQKLMLSLGVPKAYLSAEEDTGGRSQLSQEDIKFARTIQRIQKIVASELSKIALIHLVLKGYDDESMYNFDIKLTNPSTISEMMQLDLLSKRFEVASSIKDSGIIDNTYIQRNILKLSEYEIEEINSNLVTDIKKKKQLEKMESEEPTEEIPDTKEESSLTQVQRNPMIVHDPTGTKNMPYAKNYSTNIKGEATVSDKEEDEDDVIFDNLINIETKIDSLGDKKVRRDVLNRKLTDSFKTDRSISEIVKRIKEDKDLKISTVINTQEKTQNIV